MTTYTKHHEDLQRLWDQGPPEKVLHIINEADPRPGDWAYCGAAVRHRIGDLYKAPKPGDCIACVEKYNEKRAKDVGRA